MRIMSRIESSRRGGAEESAECGIGLSAFAMFEEALRFPMNRLNVLIRMTDDCQEAEYVVPIVSKTNLSTKNFNQNFQPLR